MDSVTVDAALQVIGNKELAEFAEFRRHVMESIGHKIAWHLNFRTKGVPVVEFFVFTLEEGLLIHSHSNAC
jgi:hypothetical protein